MTAREITSKLLIEIPKRFPARVRRRNVGAAVAGDRFIRFSTPGEADITGIAGPHGTCIEIEVKAGSDRLSPEQLSFLAMIERHGGIALVARDVEGTLAALAAALATREAAPK
jgi:hypothetical protein